MERLSPALFLLNRNDNLQDFMQYYYKQGRIQLFEKSGGGGQLPKKTVMVGGAPSETFERGWGALGWSPPPKFVWKLQ